MHDDESMHDEGFVGDVSDDTHLGILTYTDSQYNYVWAPHLKTLELRFPLNPQLAFQPGEAVRFVQQKDGRGPQVVHDLVKEKDIKLEVVREVTKNGMAWKAKANMVFAPPTNERFRKIKAIYEESTNPGDSQTVHALAYSDNFMEVLCFLELDVVPGVVYEGYVTRLPEPFIPLGRKMGSLFCLKHRKNTPFNTVVTDTNAVRELMERCPFADEFTRNENDDLGLPANPTHVPTGRHLTCNGVFQNGNRVSSMDNQLNDQFSTNDANSVTNYADRLVEVEEGNSWLGLIVRTADEYAVIWSPTHDLVRIQLPSGAEQQQQEQYNIATWVNYRCFEEQSQLHGGARCNYTAYCIETVSCDDRVVNTCSTEHGTEVIMQCTLTDPTRHNAQLFHAVDTFAGQIICPHDRALKELLQNEETTKVMCIFTDQYKCRWIAFAVEKQKDVYLKLDGLPAVIDAKVQPFFNRPGGRRMQQIDEQMHLMNVGARFKPPLNWTGPTECGNTVMNVLGVTIGSEQKETLFVIATSYGIARQPKRLELGTWVQATIQAESDAQAVQNPAYDSFMHEHTYRVLHSEKISPPISTRVVNKNGAEKLLLCGDLKCVMNCLRNDYLGRVEDIKRHVNPRPGESYLVEIGITRQLENRRNCYWNVLKCHGKSVKNVHKVPLQLSIHSTEEGKTCDDAHRILIDQTFDAKGHAWESATRNVSAYEPVCRPLAAKQREKLREDGLHQCRPFVADSSAAVSSSSSSSSSHQQWVERPGDSSDIPHVSSHASTRQQHQMKPFCPTSTTTNYGGSSSIFNVNLDTYTVSGKKAVGATPAPIGSSNIAPPLKKTIPTSSIKYVDNDDAILSELLRYEPSLTDKKRQGNALVVRKRPEYLLMYNAKYGLSILLPKYADVTSACEFDEKFTLGGLYLCSFVRVAEREKRQLTYEWMCKGDFRLSTSVLETRLIASRFVQVQVCCEFTKENMAKLHGDHYILKTDLGQVRMGKDFLELNGLFGKTTNVWVAFVKEIEGCHWEIVQDSWGSLMDEPEWSSTRDGQQDDSVVVQPQQVQPEPLRNKLYNHSGYFDFLFGSEVCDAMGGERYQSERYGMPNDSDAEAESDSDDSKPIENWDDSSLTSGTAGSDSFSSSDPFDAADDFESHMRICGGASPLRREQSQN